MDVLVVGAAALYDHIFPVRELPSKGRVAEILATRPTEGNAYFGGCAFNIAVTMTKLGAGCALMHAVGADFPGSDYEKYLGGQGISLDGIQVHRELQSGHAFLFYDRQGETLCFSYPGAASEPLSLDRLNTFLDQVSMVVIAPVFSPSSARIIQIARNYPLKLAVCGIAAAELMPFLGQIDILIANQYEIQSLCQACGADGPFELGPSLVYETCGNRGSRVISPSGEQWIDPAPTREIIDPTGAGDSYAGGVLASLLKGLDPNQAGVVGSVVASFVLEKMGCQTNLPDAQRVMERLRQVFPQVSFDLRG